MTLYGPYYDILDQWEEVEFVLNKISQNHSVKKVLIRLAPLNNPKKDNLFSEYALSKVKIYFNEKGISYEIKDERDK
ncbi:MAG: hypothetical protein H6681_02525 [Desulfobacteraceae bacterium]|nr:hypothetical protein [Desulfobacteraceae bacterium]MCB9494302.1 hypothetical protein [Desulfobacteraceae bacterium]